MSEHPTRQRIKIQLEEKLRRDRKAFLANGGEIEQIPFGVSSMTPEGLTPGLLAHQEAKRRASAIGNRVKKLMREG